MTALACPKCRLPLTDAALDAGGCPACGYDGPAVVAAGGKRAWLVATAAVVLGGAALGAYLLLPHPAPSADLAEADYLPLPGAPTPVLQLPPPAAKDVAPSVPLPEPSKPAPAEPPTPKPAPPDDAPPKPNPWVVPPKPVPPPKPPAPVKPGPAVRIDPKEVREKQVNIPNGTLQVPDMTRDDRLTLTGKVRVLRIGSVSGNAILDASGMEAEEVVVTGDLGDAAVVRLNAPNGAVLIGGHVVGTAKLTVTAPGGRVTLAEKSGKVSGGAEVAVTANLVEVKGTLSGNAKLKVIITGGGAYQFSGVMEDKATVSIKN